MLGLSDPTGITHSVWRCGVFAESVVCFAREAPAAVLPVTSCDNATSCPMLPASRAALANVAVERQNAR